MVRYYSDDGFFEAPIEKLWKLIEAHGAHMHDIHQGVTPVSSTQNADGSTTAKLTTPGPDGKPVAHTWRFHVRPPHAQVVEMIEGPMKGSWLTSTYLPKGNRTQVVTVAEWKVQGVTDENQLRKACEEFMENGFAEDSRYLKTL